MLLLLVAVGFFLTGGSELPFAGNWRLPLAWLLRRFDRQSAAAFWQSWSWWQEFYDCAGGVLFGNITVALAQLRRTQADGGIDVQSGIYSWRPDQSRRGGSRCRQLRRVPTLNLG